MIMIYASVILELKTAHYTDIYSGGKKKMTVFLFYYVFYGFICIFADGKEISSS